MTEEVKTRKLPRYMRRLNLAYKIILAIISGLSIIFAAVGDIPVIYFEVVSVVSSAFPIIWSQILDASKEYHSALTPAETPKVETPPVDTELEDQK